MQNQINETEETCLKLTPAQKRELVKSGRESIYQENDLVSDKSKTKNDMVMERINRENEIRMFHKLMNYEIDERVIIDVSS